LRFHAIALAICAGSAFAQQKIILAGRMADNAGSGLAGVSIDLFSVNDSINPLHILTEKDGSFRLSIVNPDTFTVLISKAGFPAATFVWPVPASGFKVGTVTLPNASPYRTAAVSNTDR
jgi:hypothetical protein